MKIVLVRHGPPAFKTQWLKPTSGAKSALDSYAASRVTTHVPSCMQELRTLTDRCVTSQLARAIDSAKMSGFKEVIESEMFNESELPYPNRLLIPLPWSVFLLVYRVLWFFGYRNNCAGKLLDQERARKGSVYLHELAIEHGVIVLVGHGIMNRLLCFELRNSGWQIDKKSGSGYWSAITLSRQPYGLEPAV